MVYDEGDWREPMIPKTIELPLDIAIQKLKNMVAATKVINNAL